MEKTKLEKLAHLSGKVTSNLSMHSGNTGSISVGSCPRRSTECPVGLLRLSRNRASDGRSLIGSQDTEEEAAMQIVIGPVLRREGVTPSMHGAREGVPAWVRLSPHRSRPLRA